MKVPILHSIPEQNSTALHYYICTIASAGFTLTNHPLFVKNISLKTDLDLLACSLARFYIEFHKYLSKPSCSKVDNALQLVNHCPVGEC